MIVTAAQIKKVVKAASKIISSQEGNYGSVNKNDNGHGMSVGKCQWNAYWGRALPLLQTIANKDQDQAREILGEALFAEIAKSSPRAWDRQEREATKEEADAISRLLSTPQGKEAQDDLADADITGYVKNGVKVGLESLKALAYYADVENQTGSGTSKEIAEEAGKAAGGPAKVGLEEIHAYALKHAVAGQYASRRANVYEAVKASNLPDISTEEKETEQTPPETLQNGSNSAKKGDRVYFIGGGVYKSSTAENAAITKDVISRCRVTATNPGSPHPYHLISQDGRGIYGWVDKENVK